MGEHVTLSEVQVLLYVESHNGIAGASEAFDRLEARVPRVFVRRNWNRPLPSVRP